MPIDLTNVALWRIFAIHYRREPEGDWELAPQAYTDLDAVHREEQEIRRGSLGFTPSETRVYVYCRTELGTREPRSELRPQILRTPTFTLLPVEESGTPSNGPMTVIDITMAIPPTWERTARVATAAYGGYAWNVAEGPKLEQSITAVRHALLQIVDDLGNPEVVQKLRAAINAEKAQGG